MALTNTWTEIASGSQTINGATLTYILEAQLTSQSVTENKSYINTRARTTLSAFASMSTYNWGFTATGCTSRTGTNLYRYATETVLTGSTVVSHNEDGTGSLTMTGSAYGSVGINIELSGSIDLPSIARSSRSTATPDPLVLSSSTNQLVVNTNRASSDFTHTVTLSFGSWSSTQNDVGESTTFSVPQSLVSQMETTVAEGTITTTTYNGSAQIGTVVTSAFRISADTSVEHPVISAVALNDANQASAAVEPVGSFIKNASNLEAVVSFGITGNYTRLASARITMGGVTQEFTLSGTTATVTFAQPAITSDSVLIEVTDNRGYTVTQTETLTLIPYEPLIINSASIYRSNAQGEASEAGAYINYSVEIRCFSGAFGSNPNVVTLSEAHKGSSDADYGSETNINSCTSGSEGEVITYTFTGVAGGSFSASGQYSIRFKVTDLFSEATGIVTLLRGVPIVSWSDGRFCVYGELCIHDQSDTSKFVELDASNPETITVNFSGCDTGSVNWKVFRFGKFVIASCRWRAADNAAVNVAWGNMYTSASHSTPNFPVSFSEITFQDIRYVAADISSNRAAMTMTTPQVAGSGGTISGTNMGDVWLARPDSGSTIGHPVYVMTVMGMTA